MEKHIIRKLITVLCQKVGNKVYMRDLEVLLNERLKDLSRKDKETLELLTRDLNWLKEK